MGNALPITYTPATQSHFAGRHIRGSNDYYETVALALTQLDNGGSISLHNLTSYYVLPESHSGVDLQNDFIRELSVFMNLFTQETATSVHNWTLNNIHLRRATFIRSQEEIQLQADVSGAADMMLSTELIPHTSYELYIKWTKLQYYTELKHNKEKQYSVIVNRLKIEGVAFSKQNPSVTVPVVYAEKRFKADNNTSGVIMPDSSQLLIESSVNLIDFIRTVHSDEFTSTIMFAKKIQYACKMAVPLLEFDTMQAVWKLRYVFLSADPSELPKISFQKGEEFFVTQLSYTNGTMRYYCQRPKVEMKVTVGSGFAQISCHLPNANNFKSITRAVKDCLNIDSFAKVDLSSVPKLSVESLHPFLYQEQTFSAVMKIRLEKKMLSSQYSIQRKITLDTISGMFVHHIDAVSDNSSKHPKFSIEVKLPLSDSKDMLVIGKTSKAASQELKHSTDWFSPQNLKRFIFQQLPILQADTHHQSQSVDGSNIDLIDDKLVFSHVSSQIDLASRQAFIQFSFASGFSLQTLVSNISSALFNYRPLHGKAQLVLDLENAKAVFHLMDASSNGGNPMTFKFNLQRYNSERQKLMNKLYEIMLRGNQTGEDTGYSLSSFNATSACTDVTVITYH